MQFLEGRLQLRYLRRCGFAQEQILFFLLF
jgi:hypothetical protein